MPVIGDRVEVLPSKAGQVSRTGVVTGLSGSLITVRWDSGEETRFVPGPGVLRVVESGQRGARPARRRTSSPARTTRARATSKSTTPRRSSNTGATAAPTRATTKQAAAAKSSATKKKAAAAPESAPAAAAPFTAAKQGKKKGKK